MGRILLAWGGTRHEAMFVGAALVATSVGITASVLEEQNLLHGPASEIILAAAVIDDVIGLIILAVVSSVTRGRVPVGRVFHSRAGFAAVFWSWSQSGDRRVVSRLFPLFARALVAR